MGTTIITEIIPPRPGVNAFPKRVIFASSADERIPPSSLAFVNRIPSSCTILESMRAGFT